MKEYWLDLATLHGDPCDFISIGKPCEIVSSTNIHVIDYDEYEKLRNELGEIKLKCEEYRKFVASWAWHGFNGSPYTEEQAIRLSNIIRKDCWDLHIKLENKKP